MAWGGNKKDVGAGGGTALRQGERNLGRRREKETGHIEEAGSRLKAGERTPMGGEEASLVAEIPQRGRQGWTPRRTC